MYVHHIYRFCNLYIHNLAHLLMHRSFLFHYHIHDWEGYLSLHYNGASFTLVLFLFLASHFHTSSLLGLFINFLLLFTFNIFRISYLSLHFLKLPELPCLVIHYIRQIHCTLFSFPFLQNYYQVQSFC